MATTTISAPPSLRIQSIDILRGLNMALMIFVNELAGVHGLPWWTYHAKTQWDVMTYVDMVFPGFLFLVGMSLPIAIRARLKKNPSQLALWGHVLLRSFSLWILGLILANGGKANSSMMHGLSHRWWEFIGVLGCSFFLSVYPSNGKYAKVHRVLQGIGVAMVVFCYAIFRTAPHAMRHGMAVAPAPAPGGVAWIDFSYPEILGLIGFAYFATCILYIPFRKWLWAPVAWLAALVAYNAAMTKPAIDYLYTHALPLEQALYLTTHQGGWPMMRGWFWPWENGSSASMVMAGVVLSILYLETKWTLRKKTWMAIAYAAITGAIGLALMGLGISKNRGTPTWCLWTMAACIVLFVLLYWLCDVKQKTAWAAPVRSAGSNTLTTYLLPDYWEIILGLIGLHFFSNPLFHSGWTGVVWCFVFTGIILGLSTLLTKAKVRLAL